jgi:hypothetical protein
MVKILSKFALLIFLIALPAYFTFLKGQSSAKALLTQADFRYIGAFDLPVEVRSADSMFSVGLTLRYVNGELRMFSEAHNPTQSLYEVRVPTPCFYDSDAAPRFRGDCTGKHERPAAEHRRDRRGLCFLSIQLKGRVIHSTELEADSRRSGNGPERMGADER